MSSLLYSPKAHNTSEALSIVIWMTSSQLAGTGTFLSVTVSEGTGYLPKAELIVVITLIPAGGFEGSMTQVQEHLGYLTAIGGVELILPDIQVVL